MKNLVFSLALVSTMVMNAESSVEGKNLYLLAHNCKKLNDKAACAELAAFYAEVAQRNNPEEIKKTAEVQRDLNSLYNQLLPRPYSWFCSLSQQELLIIQDLLHKDPNFFDNLKRTYSLDIVTYVAAGLVHEQVHKINNQKNNTTELQKSIAEAQAKANAKN